MVPICWPFIPSSGHCSHGALGPAGAAHLALLHGGSLLAPNPAPFLQHLTVGQKTVACTWEIPWKPFPLLALMAFMPFMPLQGLHGLHWVLLRGVLAGLVGGPDWHFIAWIFFMGLALKLGHGNNGRTDKPSVLAQSLVN